ncbi:ABC transporter permease [Jiangella asiatica]|nr:ABC transporter permease subunit [Jiangella asiatica]
MNRRVPLGRWFQANGWNAVFVTLVLFLFVYPVVVLVAGAFRTAPPGRTGKWSLTPFLTAFGDPRTYETLQNSAIYAVTKQVIVLVIALTLVVVSTRTDHWLARVITPMAVMVFAMPGLFFAVSWGMLGNAEIGLLNTWFDAIPLVGGWMPTIDTESWHGVIGVTALKSIAIEYLLLLGPFRAMDRSLEEAAAVSGASNTRTVLSINLPVMLPTITAVAIIGIGNVMGTLEVPLVLGLPAGIEVFSSRIYRYINAEYPAQYGEASSLSLLLVLLIVSLVLLQRRLLRGRNFETVTGKAHRRDPWHVSGAASFLVSVLILAYGVLALALPLLQLVLSSFQPFLGSLDNLSLQNYRVLLDDPAIHATIANSVVVGVLGGLLAMALAVAFAYGTSRRTPLGRFISLATWIPYALPGIVLGLAILWAFIPVPGLQLLYATVWIVMIGLVVNTVPLTSRVAETALEQISVSLEEAAQVSGASRLRTITGILLRLILPSFLIGWFVAIIMIIGNLDVPVLMSAPENQTLSVQVFRFYSAGQVTRAAALFCILLAIIVGFLLMAVVLRWVMARWRRNQGMTDLVALRQPGGAEDPAAAEPRTARSTAV